MGEKEVNRLLKDAIYMHLIGMGYSEYTAKIETEKRMTKINQRK